MRSARCQSWATIYLHSALRTRRTISVRTLCAALESSGEQGEVRRAIDNLLFNDMKAAVRRLPRYQKPAGDFDARVVYEVVLLNSVLEHHGVPT